MDTLLSKFDFRIYTAAKTELDSRWNSDQFKDTWRYTHFTRLYFPTGGNGTIVCGDRTYHLERGKMYLIFPAAVIHTNCDDQLVKYWTHFNLLNRETGIDFFAWQRNVMELPVPENKFLLYCNYFDILCRNYTACSTAERSVIDELESASALCLLLAPFLHKLVPHSEETDFFKIMDLCSYMNRNLSANVSMKELGKVIGLHPNYLSRLFRHHTGMSPIAYLSAFRIQYAMAELSRGNLRISEIAEKAGINSLQAFSRKFTKLVGMSPREYRKRMKSGSTEFNWHTLQ